MLLTGGAGFVGHHVAEHLLSLDWEVTCLVSFRHRGCPMRLRHLALAHPEHRLHILQHDLTAPINERLAEAIGEVDVVINLAAESHVDRSLTQPRHFVENNVQLQLTMLEFARQARPRVFLQLSTDEVYGPAAQGHVSREWDAMLPSNPYAASKAAQEALGIAWWHSYGLPLILVNSMNLIGERQDVEKFVPMVTRQVLWGETVTIHADERGPGSRHYLHARNLASALTFLIERGAPARFPEQDRPDRWHVAGACEVDNLEMAQMVARAAGQPLQYRLVDFDRARPGHDPRYALDASRIRQAGWEPPVAFQESLTRAVRWTVQHPEWLVPAL